METWVATLFPQPEILMSHLRPAGIPTANDTTSNREEDLRTLTRAAVTINAVMHRQKREIEAFQETTLALQEAIQRLEAAFRRYDRNLAKIRHKHLHRKALRLGTIMDGYLAKCAD